MMRHSFQLFAASLALAATFGCHAQIPAADARSTGQKLSPELARRVEILIRQRTKLPPDYNISVGPRLHSDIPGFDTVDVSFASEGQAGHTVPFLLSTDGKTVAQFNKYDISADPKTLVSDAGRPARGGPEGAPVDIVGFDDLECPYCARMNAQLFPALTERYGNKVRIVYRDFPIPQHPWALRAAVDTNCVAQQSTPGYWNMVDYIHAHASDFGGTEKSLAKANEQLDQLALDQAKKDGLKTADVEACVKKQDDTKIKASLKMGDDLGVEATPVLFINGEKLEGAYPLVDVYRMVDAALVAAGQTPPPPYVPPAPPAAPPAPATHTPGT
jgi:protein-disulfide isomerase